MSLEYVLPPPPAPSLPVDDVAGARFAVRRIWCVGRNYAAHAREMGADPARDAPFFFAKPADALVPSPRDVDEPAPVAYPPATRDYQHEIELVVAIGTAGRDVDPARALEHVWGYAVGLDMTRRDLQAAARRAGQPWEMAKGFDHAAPCSSLVPASRLGHPSRGRIWLDVDGARRQEADIADLIWSVPEILSHLSRLVALAPGDLVFTGTPEGVGPVLPGNVVRGGVDGVATLAVRIV